MTIDQHDYIIIAIIAGIIILQVWVFAVNIRKIATYKKTIEQSKNFEIVEVTVPEDWIKGIEVKEILHNPDAFRQLSADYVNSKASEEGNTKNRMEEVVPKPELKDEKDITPENKIPTSLKTHENLNALEEVKSPEKEVLITEVEEFEAQDFEFEEEEDEYSGPLKSIRAKFKDILE